MKCDKCHKGFNPYGSIIQVNGNKSGNEYILKCPHCGKIYKQTYLTPEPDFSDDQSHVRGSGTKKGLLLD